ncbi:MAG: hypothetical protein K8S97_13605 [Anaerolineae bacterium]|nr:hypothetical protein [Anaerolineae bacterium]
MARHNKDKGTMAQITRTEVTRITMILNAGGDMHRKITALSGFGQAVLECWT